MGLARNPYDPCMYSGFVKDPNDKNDAPYDQPITLGLYVDNSVYFSQSDATERKFQRILPDLVKVEFMGVVEWFLGTHFSWRNSDTETACHLNQAGFARNLVERFDCHRRAITPDATPYRSGLPINSLVPADPKDASAA